MKTLFTSLILCLIAFCVTQASAETEEGSQSKYQSGDLIIPNSGDLVISGPDDHQDGKRKCVTICGEWGRDCIINSKTGQQKCRRTCKSFGEECL